jgi:hypothetical protein
MEAGLSGILDARRPETAYWPGDIRMSRVPSYYVTPNRLHSHEDMMRVLKERTKKTDHGGSNPLRCADNGSVPGVIGDTEGLTAPSSATFPIDAAPLAAGVLDGQSPRSLQVTPSAGGGVSAQVQVTEPSGSPRPAPLEWSAPVKDEIFGTWSIKDASGRYAVLKERRSGVEGWQYLAFKGSAVLAPACSTAECAKAHCSADWEKSQ